jgi:hypothetical protein
MAKDALSLLSKMSAGALDGELNALAEKQEKLIKAKAQLRTLQKIADKEKFTKPSEYTPEFKQGIKDAGIKYSEKEGDHKKNMQLIENAVESLDDEQAQLQLLTQQMMTELTRSFEAMSSQLKQINKQQEAVLKNFRS